MATASATGLTTTQGSRRCSPAGALLPLASTAFLKNTPVINHMSLVASCSMQPRRRLRTHSQQPAHALRDVLVGRSIDRFPAEREIGDVDEDKYGRIHGHWRGGQPAVGDPPGGERDQRHREEMREVRPHQPRRRHFRIAEQVVVVDPDDRDEQVADRIAQTCGPQRQQGIEGIGARRLELENQDCDDEPRVERYSVYLALGITTRLDSWRRLGPDTRRASRSSAKAGLRGGW